MTHIWIPKVNYKEDTTITKKIEVTPSPDGSDLMFKCPKCNRWNSIPKHLINENHSFTCSSYNCFYTFIPYLIPDNIKTYIKSIPKPLEHIRPKIIRG